MCLAQGPQRSDAGEAQIHGPSVSIQAHCHWAIALPATGQWDKPCLSYKCATMYLLWEVIDQKSFYIAIQTLMVFTI